MVKPVRFTDRSTSISHPQKKPRPKRSLASRLSGYRPKKTGPCEPSGLATLLKDATLCDSPPGEMPLAPQ